MTYYSQTRSIQGQVLAQEIHFEWKKINILENTNKVFMNGHCDVSLNQSIEKATSS